VQISEAARAFMRPNKLK